MFVENTEKVSEKSMKLFNHLVNAHQIWNGRIEGDKNTFGVWEIHPTQDLKDLDKSNFRNTWLLLKKVDLNAAINYTTSKGQLFSNSVSDILFHIINHSTYHRGQIAMEFRQTGVEPLVTDYIFYKRQE